MPREFNYFRIMTVSTVLLGSWMLLFGNGPKENLRRVGRAVGIPLVESTCKLSNVFAMTFDEGPSKMTPIVLDALKKNGVKATFHVSLYSSANQWSAVVKRAFDEGHVIGLRFPPGHDPRHMAEQEIVDVLVRDSQHIYDIIKTYPRFLRFPNGMFGERELKIARQLGLVVTGWNLDSKDFTIPPTATAEESTARLVQVFTKELAESGTVDPSTQSYISIHRDLYKVYADMSALTMAVQTVKAAGFEFTTIDTCMKTELAYRDHNVGSRTATTGTLPGVRDEAVYLMQAISTPSSASSSYRELASPIQSSLAMLLLAMMLFVVVF